MEAIKMATSTKGKQGSNTQQVIDNCTFLTDDTLKQRFLDLKKKGKIQSSNTITKQVTLNGKKDSLVKHISQSQEVFVKANENNLKLLISQMGNFRDVGKLLWFLISHFGITNDNDKGVMFKTFGFHIPELRQFCMLVAIHEKEVMDYLHSKGKFSDVVNPSYNLRTIKEHLQVKIPSIANLFGKGRVSTTKQPFKCKKICESLNESLIDKDKITLNGKSYTSKQFDKIWIELATLRGLVE